MTTFGARRREGGAAFARAFPLLALLLLPLSVGAEDTFRTAHATGRGSAPDPAGEPASLRTSPAPFHPALDPAAAREIGLKIWRNECGGRLEGLAAWNRGEDFPSLGIGHFIWYPEGKSGPFRESFPALLDHLARAGVALPSWLAASRKRGCPWPDREAFLAAAQGRRVAELRALLADTVDLQAAFLAERLAGALPAMLAALDDPAARKRVAARFHKLARTPGGLYALVDYVNFKGEGVDPRERYAGEGWGLLQVLLGMNDSPDPRADFAAAADRTLTRRVANAPRDGSPAANGEMRAATSPALGRSRGEPSGIAQAADESRWLKGWRNRVATYTNPASAQGVQRRGSSR